MVRPAESPSRTAVIREAVAEDLETVLRLDARLYEYDGRFDDTLDHGWSRSPQGLAYFAERIRNDDGLVLLAEHGGRAVASLVAGEVEALEYRSVRRLCELESLFVVEDWRGSGLGRQLVQRFLDWARPRSGGHVRVEVSAGNRAAIEFYRRLGFLDYNLTLERREPHARA